MKEIKHEVEISEKEMRVAVLNYLLTQGIKFSEEFNPNNIRFEFMNGNVVEDCCYSKLSISWREKIENK